MVYENNPLEQNKAQRLANDLHRGDPQAHVDATNLLRNEFANNPRAAMDLIRVAQQQGGARGHVGVARDGTVVLQDAMGITPVGRIPTNGGNIQLEAAEVPRYNLSAGQQQPFRPATSYNPNQNRNPNSTSSEQYTTTQAQQQQRRPITTSNPGSSSEQYTGTTQQQQQQRRYPSTTNSTNTEYTATNNTNITNRSNQNYGNQNYGNQNYGNQNNFRRDNNWRPGVQFGIGVDLGLNNGYLNNGYLNNGYANGGDNQVVQRLTYDLQSGNQDDAANVIRNELNFNSRQAQFEMHQANINAGPNAPDHIRKLNDGTIVVTDSYSQTQEFAGRLPSAQIYADNQYNGYNQNQGNVINDGYANQGNVVNDRYANQGNVVNDGYANQGNVINDGNYIQDQGAIVRNPNQGYRQNNFNQNALEIGRDMQNGRMQDAANLLRNDLRCNPQQALNEIRMANQMSQGGREFIETDNRSGNVSITDRYTHQRVSVGRLPGAQVGNYYDAGVNNGYYNNNNNNNGYYNGTNDNGYYNNNNNNGYNNGITPGEYLGGAAIEGGVAGLVGGLISSAFRGNRGGYQQQQQFWPPPPPRHRR